MSQADKNTLEIKSYTNEERFTKEDGNYFNSNIIVYKLSPEEVNQSGGITCIGGACQCNKSECICVQNYKELFKVKK